MGGEAVRVTPKRLAWLRLLAESGPQKRGRRYGPIGYACMQAGWTEWDYRDPAGATISVAEAKARYGDQQWFTICSPPKSNDERLTAAGRAILAAAPRRGR